MSDRFKLEESIFQCWSIVDDIKALREVEGRICEDHLENYLLGLEAIYAIKFARLHQLFEECIKKQAFKN